MEEVLGFRIEVKGTDQQTAAMQKLSAEIDSMKKRITELNKQKKTEEGLTAAQRKEYVLLTTQLKASTTQYNKINKEILVNNGVLSKSSGIFGGLKTSILSAGTAMLGWGAAIGVVVGAVGSAIKTIRDFDESVANLAKVTGLAKEDARDFAKEIIKIDTRTSVTALLELATAGGRLGLKGQELIDFTRSADMAFVALGDSLEGSAEDIALTLGKLGSSFGLEEQYGVGESITRIGSVLNDLGAKTKATEGPIVDFTARLAGVASQAGITLPEIAALGALFDANGQSMEVAATTFQKLLPDMGANVEQFAKVAGMNVDEFSALLRDKPFAALQAVAKGAESSETGLIGLTETLKNYGVDSARAASIVSLLSSKQEDLASMVDIANTALDENTSLLNENAIKQETVNAKIEKLGKNWDEFVIGIEDGSGVLSDIFSEIINVFDRVLGFFKSLNSDNTMESLTSQAISFAESIGMINENTVLLLNATNKNAQLTESLTQKYKDGVITNEQYQKGLQKIADGFVVLTAEQKKAAKEEEALAKKKAKTAEADAIALAKAKEKAAKEAEYAKKAKEQREKDAKEREEAKKKELEAIRKFEDDYEKARAKGEKEAQEFLKKQREEFGLSSRELELLNITREFDDKIAAIIGNSASEIELRKQLEEQKRAALNEQKLVWAAEDIEAQAKIDEENLAADIKAEQEELERKRNHELLKQKIASDSVGILQSLQTVATNNELNRFDEKARRELEMFNGSEEEKKKLEEKLSKERYEIEKKAFEQRKRLQLAEIGVNLIKELSAIRANAAGNPANTFTFGGAGISQVAVLSTLAIASALANSAAVLSQKYEDGGLVTGASHKQGGVQMFHKSGQHLGEMEGNEYIISAKRTKEIGVGNLDAINFGGITPDVGRFFAQGGLVPNTTGISTATLGSSQVFDIEQLGAIMTAKMQEAILRTEIVNNASETYGVAANVINTKNSLSFG